MEKIETVNNKVAAAPELSSNFINVSLIHNPTFDSLTPPEKPQVLSNTQTDLDLCLDSFQSIADPGLGLKMFENVLHCDKITNTVVSPFDQTTLMRGIQNPLKNKELITAQYVYRNVKQIQSNDSNTKTKDSLQTLTCAEGHTLVYGERHQSKELDAIGLIFCDICETNQLFTKGDKKSWRCNECDFDKVNFKGVCCPCYNRHFVRRKLEQKTPKHHYFQKSVLKYCESNAEDHLMDEEAILVSKRSEEMFEENQLEETTQVSITEHYAAAVETEETNTVDVDCYVEVALWRFEDEEMVCYRQFRVDHPVFYHLDYDVSSFLHVSANEEVYYFCTKNKTEFGQSLESCEIKLCVIDLEKACDQSTLQLQQYESQVFLLPLQENKSFVLQGLVKELLLYKFGLGPNTSQVSLIQPPILQDNMLIVQSNKAVTYFQIDNDKDDLLFASQLQKQGKLTRTQHYNLLFCDLKQQTIKYVVYDVKVLIKLEQVIDQTYVWIFNGSNIQKIKCLTLEKLPVDTKIDLVNQQIIESYTCVQKQNNDRQASEYESDLLKKELGKIWSELTYIKEISVQGVMNSETKVCTLIFHNFDWISFKLDSHAGVAIRVFQHQPMPDAALLEGCNNKFYICGNLRKVQRKIEERSCMSYSPWLLSVYDLNQEADEVMVEGDLQSTTLKLKKMKSNQKKSTHRDYLINISTNVQVNLETQLALQYKLLPFESSSANVIKVFVYYRNIQNSRVEVFNANAVCNSASNQVKLTINQKPYQQWEQFNYIVNYPLLMYTMCSPMHNKLMVVNLGMDVPQLQIDIYPYKFLKFVSIGMDVGHKYFCVGGETPIYFLVQHIETKAVRLMLYRTFAWRQPNDETWPLSRQNNLLFLTDSILMPPMHKSNQIKEAVLLYRPQKKRVQLSVIVQYHSDRQGICALQSKKDALPLIEDDLQLQSLNLLCGPNNMAFFVGFEVNAGYQLIGVSHQNRDPQTAVLYSQRAAILAIQVQHEKQITDQDEYQVGIYIIDEDFKFKLLTLPKPSIDKGAVYVSQNQIQFQVSKIIDLKEVGNKIDRQLVPYLYNLQFPRIIMSERSVVMLEDLNEKGNFASNMFVYNLTSDTSYYVNFLQYNEDTNQLSNLTGHNNRRRFNQNNYNWDLQHVPWIGKHIAVVKEGTKTYFTTSKSPDLKRIDLMNYQQSKDIVNRIFLLDSLILVSLSTNESLQFDQHTLLLHRKVPSSFTRIMTSSHQGYQYVVHEQQYNSKSKVRKVFKYSKAGEMELVREDVISVIKKIRQEINLSLNQKDNKNNQLSKSKNEKSSKIEKPFKTIFPKSTAEFIMTKEGSVVQFIFVYKEEIGDSELQQNSFLNSEFLAQKPNDQQKLNNASVDTDPFSKEIFINIYKKTDYYTCEGNLHEGFSNDPVLMYQTFVIAGDIFDHLYQDKKKLQTIRYAITPDYLALECQTVILFVKLKDIEAINEAEFQSFSSISQISQKPKTDQFWQNLVQVKPILIAKMFDENLSKFGLRIKTVEDDWLAQAPSVQNRKNAIQISLLNKAILWDLDKNEEIVSLTGFNQFGKEENYVRTGFDIYIANKTVFLDKNIQKSSRMMYNSSQTMFTQPQVDSLGIKAVCFNLYSELCVREIVAIQKKINKDKLVRKIDQIAVLAEIKGHTIFSIFLDQAEILDLIYQQIVGMNLEVYVDESGVEFDNIYIRRLYYMLRQRYRHLNDTQNSMSYQCQVHQERKLIEKMRKMLEHYNQNKLQHQRLGELQTAINSLENLSSNKKLGKLTQVCLQDDQGSLLPSLEPLVGLLMLGRENRLSNVVSTFDDFKKLFDISSVQINNFLQQSFIQTEMTQQIKNILWVSNEQFVLVGANTTQLSQETIIEKIYQEQKNTQNKTNYLQKLFMQRKSQRKLHPVQVRILEVAWIKNNLKDLYLYLTGFVDASIYNNELVKVLLMEQDYVMQLFFKVFLPYCVYMVSVLLYMTYIITGTERDESFFVGSNQNVALRCIILIFTIFMIAIEASQAFYLRMVYFYDKWNTLYCIAYIANLTIVAIHASKLKIDNLLLIQFASFAVFTQWCMIFYWVRLSKDMSFYVLMILESLYDIGYFLILLTLIVSTFSNALLILDLSQLNNSKDSKDDYTPFINNAIANGVSDSWIAQFLLGLGDFSYSNFSSNKCSVLIWLYFVAATIVTNVAFFNILIAIISDTYARITEQKDQYALMQQTQIFADFIQIVSLNEKLRNNRYIYIVTPIAVNESQENWSGGLNMLKKTIRANSVLIENTLLSETRSMKKDIATIQTQIQNVVNSQEQIQETLLTLLKQLQDSK